MKFNKRVRRALERSGFFLALWPISAVLGGEQHFTFRHGTMDGLLGCDDRRLMIIAINNNEANNGQFGSVMDLLEAAAKRRQLTIEVAAVMNQRLYRHLVLKRGYSPHPTERGHLILHTQTVHPFPYEYKTDHRRHP